MVAEIALDPQTLVPRVVGRYTPVFVDHAEGIYVWDRNGQRYMDFTSGIAVVNAGHCHPRVVEAIRVQAGKIIHAQQNILLHEPMLDAAAELTVTLPSSLDQFFWANSGAEAIEGALKLAKIATRRPAVWGTETAPVRWGQRAADGGGWPPAVEVAGGTRGAAQHGTQATARRTNLQRKPPRTATTAARNRIGSRPSKPERQWRAH